MAQPRLLAFDTTESKIREYQLLETEIIVGSDRANGLVIKHGTISRRHAVIRRRGDRFEVSDLNSTNGTFVNEHRVYASVLIKDRDEVRFGGVGFVFLDSGAPARQAPRRGTTKLRTRVRSAVQVILIIFLIGFGATEYLLNGDVISRLVRRLTNGPAPISKAQLLSPRIAEVSATTPPSSQRPAQEPPSPPKVVSPPAIEISSARPPESAIVASPAWLTRLNYYRYLSKLPMVNENDALSDADRKHARYVMENYLSVLKEGANLGGAMHTEDSEKPWYTPEGFAAARNSDLAEGCGDRLDASSAIDRWIAGPFHRLPVLNPDLTSVGLGSYEKGDCWATGLDLHLGPEPKTLAHAIEFPPSDAVVSLEFTKYEWPDPLTACPGYVSPGLPITLEIGPWVDAKLGAHSLLRDGEPVEQCAFDAATYTNPDPFAEQRGQNALKGFGVVMMIPRQPLTPGHTYTVSILAQGHPYSWSFSVASKK